MSEGQVGRIAIGQVVAQIRLHAPVVNSDIRRWQLESIEPVLAEHPIQRLDSREPAVIDPDPIGEIVPILWLVVR